jgi:hypothetical protein
VSDDVCWFEATSPTGRRSDRIQGRWADLVDPDLSAQLSTSLGEGVAWIHVFASEDATEPLDPQSMPPEVLGMLLGQAPPEQR